jgi:hypothetical protein
MHSRLSEAQRRDLACVAGMMIPPSVEFGVPGGDDGVIIDDICNTLGRDAAGMRVALAALTALSGGSFADLDPARRETVAEQLRTQGGLPLATLTRVIMQSYYRDDRVVRSLGREPRPPFPRGNVLEQGDWSLLDPVRARPKFWRDISG